MALEAFKPIDIGDADLFRSFLRQDPPRISELTFTNLFMWRERYRPVWRRWRDCLLIILQSEEGGVFGLQPVGTGDKASAIGVLLDELVRLGAHARVCRVDETFVKAHVDPDRYIATADLDNSDYVYRASDLTALSGRRYHRKKNLVNRFRRENVFRYRPLDLELVECFLEMQENWCAMRSCLEEPDLKSEDYAIHQVLTHFEELRFEGGAIEIDGRLEAFSLGEPLNRDTAVIHIEKANPEITGLYAAINQQFCEHAWGAMAYVNREQDLGIEGLKKAKSSYNPHHIVNKYTVAHR
ncbi:MAG: DUF2156 domain-containing protein [Deltaproteobacteria bacterium]|nr:DUF2156 domain-containing protein [Deltaproteobacteria bacterium]